MNSRTRKLDLLDLLAAGSPGSAAAFFRIADAEQESHRLEKSDSVSEVSKDLQPSGKHMQFLP